jgi:hypothetical protein
MSFEVRITSRADQQLQGLRRKSRMRAEDFMRDVAARGCVALDYRLTGPLPLDHLCVKHLDNLLRAVVGFTSKESVWVLLIGPHDESDPGLDVYRELYRLLGIDPSSLGKRTKPACCGAGQPPFLGAAAEEIADRMIRLRRTRT